MLKRAVVIEGDRFTGAILWADYRLLGTLKPCHAHMRTVAVALL